MPLIHNIKLTLAANDLKQPLHARVRQILREQILNDFQHGQRFYTERELMQTLAISQATTRRALLDLVDEGYLHTDPRKGFFVRKEQDERCVGLIAPVTSTRFVNPYSEYAEVCRRHGYVLNVHNYHRGEAAADVMKSIEHKPNEERILITGLTVDQTMELGKLLQSAGYQHVVAGAKMPGFTGGSISMDHEAEASQILDHLTGLGHERILFMVNEPKNLLYTSLRTEAVRRELDRRKLKKAQLVFCDTRQWENSFNAAYQKTGAIFKAKPVPTAIVPLSGVGAWAVLRYAVQHRIDVPGQLSIVCFDPMINSDILPIPLTELVFSQEERAEKALKILWSDRPSEGHELVTPKLVVRGSSAHPG